MTLPDRPTEIEHLQRQLAASRERIATLEARVRELLAENRSLRLRLLPHLDEIHDD